MKSEREQWMRNVKGTYDYLPAEQLERNGLIDLLQSTFESFGFNPIETPILSMEEVLASKYAGGAEIMKEVYTLSDQGDRPLGLRYDLTVPFAKFISLNRNLLTYPFKKYEIGKAYRNGPIKRGRKREFIQADVDVVGSSSIFSELEFFRMISNITKELDLDVIVKYNDIRVLTSVLKSFSIKESMMKSVILIIDKLEKMPLEDLLSELKELGIDNSTGNNILNMIFSGSSSQIQRIINQDELNSFKELINLTEDISSYDKIKFEFTPSLARGLEVYTGTIWEVFVADSYCEITSSIAAGGRYDNIVGQLLNVEEKYPAVGMTFGVDVIMEVLKDKKALKKKTVVEYLIIPMSGMEKTVVDFSEALRPYGIKIDIDYSGKRIKKSLNRANKLDISYVSVFGEDERASNTIKIKEMDTGVEMAFNMSQLNDIVAYIKADSL